MTHICFIRITFTHQCAVSSLEYFITFIYEGEFFLVKQVLLDHRYSFEDATQMNKVIRHICLCSLNFSYFYKVIGVLFFFFLEIKLQFGVIERRRMGEVNGMGNE